MLTVVIAWVLAVEVPSSLTPWLDASVPIVEGWSASQRGNQLVAMARGRVEVAAHGRIEVRHVFFEDAARREVRFVAVGVSGIAVRAGQTLEQGTVLGVGKQAVIDGLPPASFLAARSPAFNPLQAARAFVVEVDARRLVALEKGVPVASWEIAIGQVEGAKEQRDDLKTPRGLFFVTERYHGSFSGDWAEFYGGYWVKLNYPNAFDAARGLDAGLITRSEADEISSAWPRRELTLQKTKLGGGIGFHSWASPWSADAGTLKSFGCVVLHPEQIAEFYARVQVGDLVVLR